MKIPTESNRGAVGPELCILSALLIMGFAGVWTHAEPATVGASSPPDTPAQTAGSPEEDTQPKFNRLFAFSARNNETFLQKAADIGVTDICGTPSPEMIDQCTKHDIAFYPLLTLRPQFWEKAFPDVEAPVQKMTGDEEQASAARRASAGRPVDYRWGGEPEKDPLTGTFNKEVLSYDILCFHNPEVLELLKAEIRSAMSHPGIAGIAFDMIGYRNYHGCHCRRSMERYREYCKQRNIEPDAAAWQQFSLDSLVDFNNALVDYVHELDPDAITFNHIWPVYLPEPLYGNRLKMDYCGQTASWYSHWDLRKIEQYSHTITTDQNKYWPEVNGVAFIGYYSAEKTRFQFPYKSPERVERELRAILKGGSRMLMVCGLDHVLDDPDISAVFKKFMQHN